MTVSPSVLFLSDHETKVDLLNNEAIARTIVQLIKEIPERPMTIGVHGDWGAGKSSVLEMIEEAFTENEKMLCIKFNGWQFQGFEDAKIAVLEGIVTELIANRSSLTNANEEVKNILRRIDWLKAAKKIGGLAFTAFTGLPTLEQLKSVLDTVKDKLSDPATLATKENAEAASELFSDLLKDGESRSVPKEIHEFRKAFSDLLKKAKIDRLIVLIDDLDRCLPETAIETLEAIRLFVFLPKTAFIVGADEAMIEYAVRNHFPDLPESSSSQGYARSYLEKLIQVPMRIPALGETETHIYVTLLAVGSRLGEDSDEFKKLLQLGRNALCNPWEGKGINTSEIKTILGDKYDDVSDLLLITEQISPILSAGTKGNPRQIKRFLNALSLRLQVSNARGFGDNIRAEILAKLMLAELFLPVSVFEHIATSAANADDGICKELNILEQGERLKETSKGQTKKSSNKEETSSEESSTLADWKMRSEVVKWASIEPKIGTTSLKPYLFVIKDRKNYLGSTAPLSPKLMALLEKLSGGEANAMGCRQDLTSLTSNEIESLLQALRSKLLGSNAFSTKPPTIFGIAELVQAHPKALQMRYVEILEELPVKQLGPWAAAGHEKIITDQIYKAQLERLIQNWRTNGSTPLKAALSAQPQNNRGQ
ncbi:KAP family P-loop domain protein [Legionella moravica]|uniref:KAP family P-loop domain protein n=1 Tax=Legionella moravica TaxID=39962 RepID=A0A378JW18_9GAMM|nr:Qat anti-phage system ATPase QatA [Legionella moravica]KTD37608.1 KAP family P-loop domain protein [Legionella moravica]STX61672.1 Predicted P-loop ATPase [Legionella moravica]HEN5529746.1 NTPase KAP [Legionella pneumophila]